MGKKRGNGEGSVLYRKDRKRWVAQVQIETESGRAKRKTFYGKTQAEVLEKKRQFERELDTSPGVKGPVTEPITEGLTHANTSQVIRGLTVNQLFDMWLDSLDCEFKTLENYKSIANNHVRPSLGERQVSEVSSLLIQELYNKKREEGYSPRTIEYIHRTLHPRKAKSLTRWISPGRTCVGSLKEIL